MKYFKGYEISGNVIQPTNLKVSKFKRLVYRKILSNRLLIKTNLVFKDIYKIIMALYF